MQKSLKKLQEEKKDGICLKVESNKTFSLGVSEIN